MLILSAMPSYALDFQPDDFEPADIRLASGYNAALEQLYEEVSIIARTAAGIEIFRAIPYPLELVAMQTQAEIHTRNITDPDELGMLIAEANMDKPGSGWFVFLLDGDPSWVNGTASIVYSMEPGGREFPVEVDPVELTKIDDSEFIMMCVAWIIDVDQLVNFMNAAKVWLIAANEDATEQIRLDVSFWRDYTLFDVRVEQVVEE